MKFEQGAIRIPPQQCLQIVTANDLLVERIPPPRKRGRTRGRVQSWLGLIRRHHSDARGATGQKGEQGDADQTQLRDRVATGNRIYGGSESHRHELSAHRASAGKGLEDRDTDLILHRWFGGATQASCRGLGSWPRWTGSRTLKRVSPGRD